MSQSTEQSLQPCCCCPPKEDLPAAKKTISTSEINGSITPALNFRDFLGFVAMRLGFGRDRYSIKSGLYVMGTPTPESPVLVTANYKMTVDVLRSHLTGIDAWILVLDTHGVNVWCAAGKGTFSTEELVNQVTKTGLSERVSHRNLIVPQLGAPGIAAHEVKKRTGFKVNYGPIRAKDVKPYIEAGMKTTPTMRQMEFPFQDRIVLAPLELVVMFKWFFLVAACVLLLSGLHGTAYSVERIVRTGLPTVGILFGCWIGAAFLIPALLPWIPGRMLSVKGLCVGIALGGLIGLYGWLSRIPFDNGVGLGGLALIVIALSSYFGLILTGSMPYTSLSGVRKEMRKTVPVIAFIFVSGFIIWCVGRFV